MLLMMVALTYHLPQVLHGDGSLIPIDQLTETAANDALKRVAGNSTN